MSNFLQHFLPNMKEEAKPFRILSIGDLHCGNVAGLTPPEYNPTSEDSQKEYIYRTNLWTWFLKTVQGNGPYDLCVANGDLIDGKGPKTGGNEQIYASRPKQIEIATAVLKAIPVKEFEFTFGTGYHVGPEDDWETEVAQNFDKVPHDVFTRTFNGITFKWRHHIGGGQAYTGKATQMFTQMLNDILWAESGEFAKADVMVFGHVHRFVHVQDAYRAAFIVPALQGLGGSQLGARRLGHPVQYGFVVFDIDPNGGWSWNVHLLKQTPAIRGE